MEHQKDMLTVPALVGIYAIAGLYIQRAMRGSSSPLHLENVLVVGGTSAVAAVVAPMLTKPWLCPYRPLTPIANAAVSSALAYLLMRVESVDADGAAMFIPVQMISSLLAQQVAHMMWKMNHKKKKTLLEQQNQ